MISALTIFSGGAVMESRKGDTTPIVRSVKREGRGRSPGMLPRNPGSIPGTADFSRGVRWLHTVGLPAEAQVRFLAGIASDCRENEIQPSLISSGSAGATPAPATNFGRAVMDHLGRLEDGAEIQSPSPGGANSFATQGSGFDSRHVHSFGHQPAARCVGWSGLPAAMRHTSQWENFGAAWLLFAGYVAPSCRGPSRRENLAVGGAVILCVRQRKTTGIQTRRDWLLSFVGTNSTVSRSSDRPDRQSF